MLQMEHLKLIKKRERKINWVKRQVGRAQSNNEGLMKRGGKKNHMFIWDRLMNEACQTRQNKKRETEKSEQQEQIIIHGTVESLDKQTTNVSLIKKPTASQL